MGTRVLLRRDACGGEQVARPSRSTLRRRALVRTLCASLATLAIVPSAGAGVLDQSQPGIRTGHAGLGDTFHRAQTFTNGITGGLDQVDLAVGRSNPSVTVSLVVEIRPLSGGVPGSPALASSTLPAASVPVAFFPSAFLSVPLAAPAPVLAGVQYAIVVSSSSSCGFLNCYGLAFGPVGDPYPAGLGLSSSNAGATWAPFSGFGSTDFPFKTYVLQPPTKKQQCKKGGWRKFRNPAFKNQGQCVKFVNHQGGTGGKGKDDDESHGKKKNGKKK